MQYNANSMPPGQEYAREFFNFLMHIYQQGKQIKNKQQQSTCDARPTQCQCNATGMQENFSKNIFDAHLLAGKTILK